MPDSRSLRAVSFFVLMLLLAGGIPACSFRPPIRIGFAAEISGKQSELGIDLRNGVEMAVDEINAGGGIRGRQIELLIEDDLGSEEGARAAEKRLVDAGVTAVIGHFTSSQTQAGLEVTSASGVLLLSATASTSLLSRQKDLFLRTVVSSDWLGSQLGEYVRTRRGVERVAILFDQDNVSYSQPMTAAFSERFTALGGQVTSQIGFSGGASPDFSPLVRSLRESDPQAVLIIASPLNAAVIAQTIALQGWQPVLFAASWAQGEGLIQNGGRAVEGMEMMIGFDVNDPSPKLGQFKTRYEKHYDHPPGFSAMEGYETMHMLAEALALTGGSADGLPEALTGLDDFEGLTGPVKMDEFGDAVRPLFIQRVSERRFITIDRISPQE